ncbi:arginine deiminase family protein [Nonomuraea sp. NPDC004186]
MVLHAYGRGRAGAPGGRLRPGRVRRRPDPGQGRLPQGPRRERWDSGGNFLALEPGVVVGYHKNQYANRGVRAPIGRRGGMGEN